MARGAVPFHGQRRAGGKCRDLRRPTPLVREDRELTEHIAGREDVNDQIAPEGVDADREYPVSNEVKRVPGIAFVKDDVPLSNVRWLATTRPASTAATMRWKVFAARVWSPSFGLGRHDSQLLQCSTP
jgi:hypothetical protein